MYNYRIKTSDQCNIPIKVQQILKHKYLRRPSSQYRTPKQNTNESFWVSPLHLSKTPDVIHKTQSNIRNNVDGFQMNDINLMRRTQTPKKRMRTENSTKYKNSSFQLSNQSQSPNRRQENYKQDSFLNILEQKTGMVFNYNHELLSQIYGKIKIDMSISQQRDLVKNCVLMEYSQLESKNILAQTFMNNQSPYKTQQYKFIIKKQQINYEQSKQQIEFQQRLLIPEEEAIILESMLDILDAAKNLEQIFRLNVRNILIQILTLQKLDYLNQYPQCMKQMEYHWQILVTRLLCNTNTELEQQLQMYCKKGHALDLRQQNVNKLGSLLQQYIRL